MKTFEFDGEKYKKASKHQKEWGNKLISQLSLKGNEIVLDLGCGDGVLTQQISLLVPNGKVLGIDASKGMIQTAKTYIQDNLYFDNMDINKINFTNQFDVIFSNAALHWIINHKRLLKNVHKALKENGFILWNFAGDGTCLNFYAVVKSEMRKDNYNKYFSNFKWPWYMPKRSEYEELINDIGFSQFSITEENADRYFANSDEMIRWIDQPCLVPFIECIDNETDKIIFRNNVIESMLKRTLQDNGTCFEVFRRLRVYAKK